MNFDELLKPTARGLQNSPEEAQDKPNFLVDTALGVPRGIEGAIQSIYDIADFATFDVLPDYDTRFLGRSKTFGGSMTEGVTQFLTGFIPIAGQVSKVGKLSKVGKAGKRSLNLKGAAVSGAIADATMFQAQEERLSNLIQSFPSLENPVTQYLASDEDDGEIEGRFKNAVEGLAIGGVVDSLVQGVKAIKRYRKGDDPETVANDFNTTYNQQADEQLLKDDFETTTDFRAKLNELFRKEYGGDIIDDTVSIPKEVPAYEALRLFSQNYDGELKPLVDALLKGGENSLKNTKILFNPTRLRNGKLRGSTYADGLIEMGIGGERTFIHEMMHAVTSTEMLSQFGAVQKQLGIDEGVGTYEATRLLQANKDALEKIAGLNKGKPLGDLIGVYLKAIKALDVEKNVFGRNAAEAAKAEIEGTFYGFTNLDEFIAETFTNPEFRRILSKIPSETGNRSIFDEFLASIKKLLGIENQGSIVDDIFKYTDDIIQKQEARYDGTLDFLRVTDELANDLGGSYGQNYRTLDDRGDDFKMEEGEKTPISEMQVDERIGSRRQTAKPFTINFGKGFRGQDISEVPDSYLRRALDFDSVPDKTKMRIEEELNARQDGSVERPRDEFIPERTQGRKVKNADLKAAELQLQRGPVRVDSDMTLEEFKNPRTAFTPREMYERYRKNRAGGKGNARLQSFAEYVADKEPTHIAKYKGGKQVGSKETAEFTSAKFRKEARQYKEEGGDFDAERIIRDQKSFDEDLILQKIMNEDIPSFDPRMTEKEFNAEIEKFKTKYRKEGIRRDQVWLPYEEDYDKYFKKRTREDILNEGSTATVLPLGKGEVINHSGGAKGSDSVWGEVGEEFGVKSNHYYVEGNKTPKGNVAISKQEALKADEALKKANESLGRTFPTSNDYVNNLLRRNFNQVDNADAVYAITEIKGNKPQGGTGWAVQMAVDMGKPVFVYSQEKGQWMTFTNGKWGATDTPTLTNNFAGIGTREITEKGKQAIRDVYEKSFKESDDGNFLGQQELKEAQTNPTKAGVLTNNMLIRASQEGDPAMVAPDEMQMFNSYARALGTGKLDGKKVSKEELKEIRKEIAEYGKFFGTDGEALVAKYEKGGMSYKEIDEEASAMFEQAGKGIQDKVLNEQIMAVPTESRLKIADMLEAKQKETYNAAEGGNVSSDALGGDMSLPSPAWSTVIKKLRGGDLPTRDSENFSLGQQELDDFVEGAIEQVSKKLRTGGDKAILNMAKNIRTTKHAMALISGIAKNLNRVGKKETITKEQLAAETENTADILGGDKATWARAVHGLQNSMDLREFRDAQRAAKSLMDLMSQSLVETARKAKQARTDSTIDLAKSETEFISQLEILTEVMRIYSLMGREAGITLLQRNFLGNAQGKFRINENIGFDFIAGDPESFARYNTQQIGGQNVKDLVDKYIVYGSDEAVQKGTDEITRGVTQGTKGVFGGKLGRMVTEYWMNSLLSGPTTQVVNTLGSGLTTALRMGEMLFGSVLSANTEQSRAILKYAFDMESIVEAFKFAGKAWSINDSVLVQGSRQFDDQIRRQENIVSDRGDAVGGAINMIGKGVRLPSRGLMTVDEFFKQLNYRSFVRMNLAMEALKKNGDLTGKELAKEVDDKFKNYITEGGRAYNEGNLYLDAVERVKKDGIEYGTDQGRMINYTMAQTPFNPEFGALADAAKNYAEVNTFTNELDDNTGVVSVLGNLISKGKEKLPIFNFVVPFVRTPTNILKFSLDRTPFGLGTDIIMRRDKLSKEVFSDDPMVAAAARGRLATGVAFSSAMLWYAMSNKDFITGGGPQSREEQDILRNAGWQPYSIKVGGTYRSYQRLDPIATIIGLFADMAEYDDYYDKEGGSAVGDLFSMVALSFTNNVTNKSYVKGLDSLLQAVRDPENQSKGILGNVVGGFMPTFVNQLQNVGTDRTLREARSVMDYFTKKGINSDTLPAKRNFLGEAQTVEIPTGGPLNPIYRSTESTDPVDQELKSLLHGFSRPSSKLMGALELKDIYREDGRQAYDVWLEKTSTTKIKGKTLRQYLNKLVKSKEYQALPSQSDSSIGEKSPRIRAINNWLRVFRNQAKQEMLAEFPELDSSVEQLLQEKQQYRLMQ
jgi:hypothetical protein